MNKNFFDAIKNNILKRKKDDYILKIYNIFKPVYYFLLMHLTNADNKIVFKYLMAAHNDDLQKTIKTRFFKKPVQRAGDRGVQLKFL